MLVFFLLLLKGTSYRVSLTVFNASIEKIRSVYNHLSNYSSPCSVLSIVYSGAYNRSAKLLPLSYKSQSCIGAHEVLKMYMELFFSLLGGYRFHFKEGL